MTDFSPPTSPEVVITCEVETSTSPSMQVINLVAFILSDLLVCGHDYFILIRIFFLSLFCRNRRWIRGPLQLWSRY